MTRCDPAQAEHTCERGAECMPYATYIREQFARGLPELRAIVQGKATPKGAALEAARRQRRLF